MPLLVFSMGATVTKKAEGIKKRRERDLSGFQEVHSKPTQAGIWRLGTGEKRTSGSGQRGRGAKKNW